MPPATRVVARRQAGGAVRARWHAQRGSALAMAQAHQQGGERGGMLQPLGAVVKCGVRDEAICMWGAAVQIDLIRHNL